MVDNMYIMTLGDRIKKRLLALSMSQAKLAQIVGISPQAIGKIISGGTSHTAHLYKIARALNTSPEYLAGETDDHSEAIPATSVKLTPMPDDEDDMVTIQEIDLAFGMGASYLDVPVKEKPRIFSRTLLQSFTRAHPSKIFMARGIGDSMAPTIHNDDIILIDASADTIRMSDQIWACAYADFGMIKRLRPTPDGGVLIMSDNPNVSDATAYDGELHVIGKVVAIIRRMAS
jgi:phage repressor protein C with HTH and peptisase S24 domain